MIRLATLMAALLLSACTTMQTAPSKEYEEKLSNTSLEVLSKIVWEAKFSEIHANATESFQNAQHPAFMRQRLRKVFESVPQNRISINGFETYPNTGSAVVYATSESNIVTLYYRLAFENQADEFKLSKFGLNRDEFPKEDHYRTFADPVVVDYDLGSLLK